MSGLRRAEGVTPREVIWRQDRLRLYRYGPGSAPGHGVPLLIVYALVNRPTMLDLAPGRSFIAGLLARGIEVYLLDWGYPDAADRHLAFEDYLDDYLDSCVSQVSARHGGQPIDLLGVCQGGVISLCYAALHPGRLRRLVTLVTPVDFAAGDNSLARLVRDVDVDALVDALGTVPGELMSAGYLALQPHQQLVRKYLAMPGRDADPEERDLFLRMEQWIYDSPAQAGEMFRQFARDCFQRNLLVRGELEIGGQRIDLSRIRLPVLNVYGRRDHLVPPPSSQALGRLLDGGDYTERAIDGGHIGIFVGRRSEELQDCVANWLKTGAADPGDGSGAACRRTAISAAGTRAGEGGSSAA